MRKCEQCLYYPKCDEYPFDESGCDDFKDCSEFVEVVHGRWVHPKGYVVSNGFFCSNCGYEEVSLHAINPRSGGFCIADEHGNFFHPPKKNYCSNCGAKMEVAHENHP